MNQLVVGWPPSTLVEQKSSLFGRCQIELEIRFFFFFSFFNSFQFDNVPHQKVTAKCENSSEFSNKTVKHYSYYKLYSK